MTKTCSCCGATFTVEEFLALDPASGGPHWYGLALRNCDRCNSTLSLTNPEGVCFDCGAPLTDEGDCPHCN